MMYIPSQFEIVSMVGFVTAALVAVSWYTIWAEIKEIEKVEIEKKDYWERIKTNEKLS